MDVGILNLEICTNYIVNLATGLLSSALQVPSPNQDARPQGIKPELILIHSISLPPGEFGGSAVKSLFTNSLDWTAHPYYTQIKGLLVSTHLFIPRQGQVVQFVPLNRRAWHAGKSSFQGREFCNDFSIGIELEGTDEVPYTDEQYNRLTLIVDAIFDAYPEISIRKIAGHCDVSPGRKTDPGPAFDWLRMYDGLKTPVEAPKNK
tara:strand:- start:138 stop:752 length:615 start_codon:yes stop_codon:yes gene_type:complete